MLRPCSGRVPSCGALRFPWLAAGIALVALGAAAIPARAAGGKLAAQDVELPAIPWLVLPAQWEGRPAIMAFSRGEAPLPGAPAGPTLTVLGARSGAFKALATWPLPAAARWVEPLNLAGGESAWLLLDGQSLEVGRVQNGTLVWQRLCACDSLYAKTDPEELSARLARDLDADGADEVLLPTATGLEVYRTLRWGTGDAAPIALAPVARLLWEPDGKPLAPAPKVPQPAAPELIGSEAGGARRLLRMIPGGFTALRLPARDTLPAEIQLDAATRARATAASLSPRGLEALARVPDGAFKDGNALVAALARVDPGGAIAADLPALTISLEGKWPETEPERVAFPDLDAGPDDRGYVLALEDLTGDGIPDLVFGLVRNESQILKIESELRFYPGTGRAALAFGTPQVLKFHGPAVGAVLRNPAPHSSPPRDGAAGRVLLVARTDVSLGALLRVMSSHEATVEATAYGIGPEGFEPRPRRTAQLTFRGFQEGSQVLMVAADLAGTGGAEVLMNLRPDAISVFASDAAGPILSKEVAALPGPLPRKREEILAGDWQDNGRTSLLFWYRGSKTPAQQRRTLRLVFWEPER